MRRKHKYHRDEVRELEAIKDNTMTTTKPNPATEPTLEPCPFCGGPAEKRLTDGPKRGFIGCFTCMIGLPFNAPYGDTEVAAWNFRAPTNAPPLCPVHASLDSTDELELEIGNDCIACSLNQRTEMLKILEPHVPAGEQVDAVEFLRAKLAPASAAPIKHYFCSCGGALTAEEYIIHYFEMGHDRGDPAFTASAAPVVDANEIVRQIRDKMVNGNPATLLADIAELVAPKRHEGESKCEHGIPWSMECLTCGPSDYVAAAATAAPQQSRSNHFNDAALDKGMFPDHISATGTAYYSDGTVLPPNVSPVEQTVHVSEHPVTLHCNTCGLVQVKSFKCPRGDGQLVVGAAPVEQSESQ